MQYVPNSMRDAGRQISLALSGPPLPKDTFLKAWYALAYLFPGLHPDESDNPDGGWHPALRRFATEAWHRADKGELADDELYPSNAAWAGIADRIPVLTDEEASWRLGLMARP
jgi:hypothetical protein